MPEKDDSFLALFPHRYDYIYAPHPGPEERPQWQTESRHPLSDRLIQQGAYLYGVRFGSKTQYCLLDIDVGSAYHPNQDPLAANRIVDALEALGLTSYVACTSSYSQGLHLYFPFEVAQNAWQISAAVTALLENQGFQCQPGHLEIFPNRKLYLVDEPPNLFNAHRLPLQAGSYLLNAEMQPIQSSHSAFIRQWQRCQQRNVVSDEILQQVLKQTHRRRHCVSHRADKFLNDLNAEIEPGWTGKGQTNYLLGRITMRTYVFHHVMYGGMPLNGEALVATIVAVAQSLPGYRDWCNHQHEIHHRAAEWARSVENSHYFPYGTHKGKYKAKTQPITSGAVEKTWNEQRAQTAQDKIRIAVADLATLGQLPDQVTARFKKLVEYGIGGSTLYKYKALWHPDLFTQPSKEGGASATASPAIAPYPTSLLPGNDSNPLCDKDLSQLEAETEGAEVCKTDAQTAWRQLLQDLKDRRTVQKTGQQHQKEVYLQSKAVQDTQHQVKKMVEYLRSKDPILIREGLRWIVAHRSQVTESWLQVACGDSVSAVTWFDDLVEEYLGPEKITPKLVRN